MIAKMLNPVPHMEIDTTHITEINSQFFPLFSKSMIKTVSNGCTNTPIVISVTDNIKRKKFDGLCNFLLIINVNITKAFPNVAKKLVTMLINRYNSFSGKLKFGKNTVHLSIISLN